MGGNLRNLVTLIQRKFDRLRLLLGREIWQPAHLTEKSPRARLFAVLRIGSITWTGLMENKIASRAGALSYSSLLGLGPLVAIAVLFSGFVLQRSDPELAVDTLNHALLIIAPQLNQYDQLPAGQAGSQNAPATGNAATTSKSGKVRSNVRVNPELVKLLNNIIEGSQSKAIGLVGALVLIAIVIQLFTSVENAFNTIWGVRRGRSWILRIVFYWTVVTLGAVLTFAALTLLSASTFVSVLESLPLGTEIRWFFTVAGPLISVGALVLLLTIFYRVIPNTKVNWLPAVVGAVFVVAFLYINNLLAFLYFRRVVLSQSLYGSVGFLPILMIGFFVFWFIVLVGGQITYAIQNANYRSSQTAWNDLNQESKETLSLLVLTMISRRFRECQPPHTASSLAKEIKIPTQILNESLNRLIDLKLITSIPPEHGEGSLDYRYQPARPLERIALSTFKHAFNRFGDSGTAELIGALDPVVDYYRQRLTEIQSSAFGNETVASIIQKLEAKENGASI